MPFDAMRRSTLLPPAPPEPGETPHAYVDDIATDWAAIERQGIDYCERRERMTAETARPPRKVA
jgi:hypothetical protein